MHWTAKDGDFGLVCGSVSAENSFQESGIFFLCDANVSLMIGKSHAHRSYLGQNLPINHVFFPLILNVDRFLCTAKVYKTLGRSQLKKHVIRFCSGEGVSARSI